MTESNKFAIRRRLADGETLVGFSLGYAAPGIIELAGGEWDWFWIDGQHGPFDYRAIAEAIRACEIVGVPAVVRVPGHDYSIIGPVLDACAPGLLIPMVDTPEDAERIVQATRFPPLGKRSFGGRRVFDMRGPGYYKTANDEVFVMAQIETVTALENCEAIAATEGIDALFVGPADLRLSMGLALETPSSDPSLQAAFDRVIAACKAHGKHGAILGSTMEDNADLVRRGYQLVIGGRDVGILRDGIGAALERVKSFREEIGK